MFKVHYDQLVIEVTRKCNMSCAHCMRGECQNKDISNEIIDKMLENVESICTITFTGGEVTLNVPAIRHTLETCKKNHINVQDFYIVTNGKSIPDEFLIACIEWYSYITEANGGTDYSGVALSQDIFHENIPLENEAKLQAFSFFREDDKDTDWDRCTLINEGRAKNLVGYKKRELRHEYPEVELYSESSVQCFSFEGCPITVTVNGDILSGCDYAYDNTKDITIGNIDDPKWIIRCAAEHAA